MDTLSAAVSIDDHGSAAAARPALDAAPVPRRAPWWGELLTIAWLCWIYDIVNNAAPLRLHLAIAHGRDVLALETTLGIDPERALDHWLAAHRTLGLALSDYYDNAHFVVTLGLLGLVWWRRADVYRSLRNILVAVNVVGFLVFWLYPVAPPRMLGGFTDVVSSTGAFGSYHGLTQANQLAAMPSLHIGWALWCALAVWKLTERWWLRALVVCHVLVTGFVVLATGNHYVLDLLAGVAALGVAVLLARWLDAAEAFAGERVAPRVRARLRPLASKP